jgi:CheY-like chemotaxis protein
MQKLILLIDDDKDEFFILNQAVQLAELSHICMWANSIERAEHMLDQMLPDLILIDYNMPKANGIVCLERLSKMQKLNNVQKVMYSNYITDINRELVLSKGASCVQKPGSLLQLVQYLIKIAGEGKVLHSLK